MEWVCRYLFECKRKLLMRNKYSQSIDFRINSLLLCCGSTRLCPILIHPVKNVAVKEAGLLQCYYSSNTMQLKEEGGTCSIWGDFFTENLANYGGHACGSAVLAAGGCWSGGWCLALTPSVADVEEGTLLERGRKVGVWSRTGGGCEPGLCHGIRFGMKDVVPTPSDTH